MKKNLPSKSKSLRPYMVLDSDDEDDLTIEVLDWEIIENNVDDGLGKSNSN